MIDILVGFIVIAGVYLLGLFSGLFAASQIIAGKEREEHEKNITQAADSKDGIQM